MEISSTSYASTSCDADNSTEINVFENEDTIKKETEYSEYEILNYDKDIITIDDDLTPNDLSTPTLDFTSFFPRRLSVESSEVSRIDLGPVSSLISPAAPS